MASFQGILDGLRRAEKELEAQLAGIRAAVGALTGGGGASTGRKRGRPAGSKNKRGPGRPSGSTNKGIIIVGGKMKRKRRKMSAKARAAISAAQKARWAKQKAGK